MHDQKQSAKSMCAVCGVPSLVNFVKEKPEVLTNFINKNA